MATDRNPGLRGEVGDPADDLAGEARGVEPPLAGDHEVGAVEVVVEIEFVGDEFEAGYQPSSERGERPAEPARRATADDRRHVDAELVVEHLREPFEPTGQHLHLGR